MGVIVLNTNTTQHLQEWPMLFWGDFQQWKTEINFSRLNNNLLNSFCKGLKWNHFVVWFPQITINFWCPEMLGEVRRINDSHLFKRLFPSVMSKYGRFKWRKCELYYSHSFLRGEGKISKRRSLKLLFNLFISSKSLTI